MLPHETDPDGLIVNYRQIPTPGRGQALVTVEATGISFAEQGMLHGRYPGQPRYPFVPGYDLVGTVSSVGPGADTELIGRRAAALTRTGAWTTHALVTAADLVTVPDSLDSADAETLVVNGITSWQLLHRKAHVRAGQTILIHGANGGVGTILVQLATHAGLRVIAAAAPRHHATLRALGAEPVDYADQAAQSARIRELAPGGVDIALDNIGGTTLERSWQLLAPGGIVICYALAEAARGTGNMLAQWLGMLARLQWWNTIPNGRRAAYYDIWGGHLLRRDTWHAHLHEDLNTVFALATAGIVRPHVAARFPLTEVSAALKLAGSRTTRGKIILLPRHQTNDA